jgi:hypothetical protein
MRAALLLAALVVLSVGCGASEDEPPSAADGSRLVSFDEARDAEDGTLVELGGAVYADDEPMRVCRELAESYPPQCGAGIPVSGVAWDELPDVQRASGVTWTDTGVGLVGTMRGGTLHVREVRPFRASPPSTPAPSPPGSDPDEPVSSYD